MLTKGTGKQDKKLKPDYARAVRDLRDDMKLTQARFADLVQVQLNTVARWESGKREPEEANYMRLERLAEKRLGTTHRLTRFFFEKQIREALIETMATGEPGETCGPKRGAPYRADPLVERYYNNSVMGIDMLAESAMKHPGAKEELHHLADEITRLAGKWKKLEG